MSFELPRRAPELRFSVRAVTSARAVPPTLGRARPKTVAPAPLPRVPDSVPIKVAPPPPRNRDVYALEPEPTAYFGPTSMREPEPSISEDETLMLDHDAAALARAKAMAPRNALPVPNFRPAEPVVPTTVRRPAVAPQKQKPSGGVPMIVWVMTAIVAGLFSYRFAPAALDRVETMTKLLSSR